MKPYVITIARQYGSGGKTVGKMLADKLGIPFYNRGRASQGRFPDAPARALSRQRARAE